ncbi:MAG: acetylglutamate kinase [Phycisphaerales bacterium]|nr:acetylglutamate kinase [Phycisphaerales bacterium]
MLDVSILLQALPYIRQFRNRLFVVKFGGELLRDRAHLDAIATDLTLLDMVGIQLVVVHGGGPQANELSESLGFKPQMVEGRRVTDAAALEVAKMVFAGKINTEVLGALNKHGGKGVGLSGVDAALIRAHRRPVTTVIENGLAREVDFGFVGDVESVDPSLLQNLVERDFIPVVASLAADPDGTILNINADTIAAEVALAMKAEKLIVMTTVPGVYKDFATKAEMYSRLSVADARALIKDGTAGKGMSPKLKACAQAVEGGVREAHIINGLEPHSLLIEIFTESGAGTMISREGPPQLVRPPAGVAASSGPDAASDG